jgi:hypothetical protein
MDTLRLEKEKMGIVTGEETISQAGISPPVEIKTLKSIIF